MNSKKIKPVVKWAGGKGQLISEIQKHYPSELGKTIKKYAEPFVGGGAVLFDILSNYELDEVYISDINAELINTYCQIRDNVDNLIILLEKYEEEYSSLDGEARKAYYYEKRNHFNKLKKENIQNINLAALFIFINRTCFNGLYRVNKAGEYNVPIGSYKKPTICDVDNLKKVSKAFSHVSILCGDYRMSTDFIDAHTFVYFDPPYRPLNITSNFTSYTKNDFSDEDQKELAAYIKKLSNRGSHIVVSNSDPKNTDSEDNFFDFLYSEFKIERIYASRMINSNAGSRGKITELLISNF